MCRKWWRCPPAPCPGRRMGGGCGSLRHTPAPAAAASASCAAGGAIALHGVLLGMIHSSISRCSVASSPAHLLACPPLQTAWRAGPSQPPGRAIPCLWPGLWWRYTPGPDSAGEERASRACAASPAVSSRSCCQTQHPVQSVFVRACLCVCVPAYLLNHVLCVTPCRCCQRHTTLPTPPASGRRFRLGPCS